MHRRVQRENKSLMPWLPLTTCSKPKRAAKNKMGVKNKRRHSIPGQMHVGVLQMGAAFSSPSKELGAKTLRQSLPLDSPFK